MEHDFSRHGEERETQGVARVAGVVLAAGLSKRLGEPKQLVQLCGKPALQHALDAARQTSLNPLLLVLGPNAETILEHIDATGFEVVRNPRAAEGQATSLQTAILALPVDVDAIVVLLGDQPFIDPHVINRVCELYEETKRSIIQPRYREGPGHPVLIARELFPELLRLTGDTGARPLLTAPRDMLVYYDVSNRSVPIDLDTPEDVAKARQQCQEYG